MCCNQTTGTSQGGLSGRSADDADAGEDVECPLSKRIAYFLWCGGGGGGCFLACEDFGRMFDNSFPACVVCLLLFF